MLATLFVAALALDAPPPGFAAIFNGKNLDDWRGFGQTIDPFAFAKKTPEQQATELAKWDADARKHWSVQDGELVNDGEGAYLATAKDYRDFELLID